VINLYDVVLLFEYKIRNQTKQEEQKHASFTTYEEAKQKADELYFPNFVQTVYGIYEANKKRINDNTLQPTQLYKVRLLYHIFGEYIEQAELPLPTDLQPISNLKTVVIYYEGEIIYNAKEAVNTYIRRIIDEASNQYPKLQPIPVITDSQKLLYEEADKTHTIFTLSHLNKNKPHISKLRQLDTSSIVYNSQLCIHEQNYASCYDLVDDLIKSGQAPPHLFYYPRILISHYYAREIIANGMTIQQWLEETLDADFSHPKSTIALDSGAYTYFTHPNEKQQFNIQTISQFYFKNIRNNYENDFALPAEDIPAEIKKDEEGKEKEEAYTGTKFINSAQKSLQNVRAIQSMCGRDWVKNRLVWITHGKDINQKTEWNRIHLPVWDEVRGWCFARPNGLKDVLEDIICYMSTIINHNKQPHKHIHIAGVGSIQIMLAYEYGLSRLCYALNDKYWTNPPIKTITFDSTTTTAHAALQRVYVPPLNTMQKIRAYTDVNKLYNIDEPSPTFIYDVSHCPCPICSQFTYYQIFGLNTEFTPHNRISNSLLGLHNLYNVKLASQLINNAVTDPVMLYEASGDDTTLFMKIIDLIMYRDNTEYMQDKILEVYDYLETKIKDTTNLLNYIYDALRLYKDKKQQKLNIIDSGVEEDDEHKRTTKNPK